jgi:DNA-binding CsgD family transcriptional regulator
MSAEKCDATITSESWFYAPPFAKRDVRGLCQENPNHRTLFVVGLSRMETRTRVNVHDRSQAVTAMSPANSQVDDLIRIIVAKTAQTTNPQLSPNGPSEQILLDIHLDGERYLLVRMPKPSHIPLSPREIEIVRMVAQGHPNKIIADVLSISSWTVCAHLRRIFTKLGVASRAAMVARLLECGELTDWIRNSHI